MLCWLFSTIWALNRCIMLPRIPGMNTRILANPARTRRYRIHAEWEAESVSSHQLNTKRMTLPTNSRLDWQQMAECRTKSMKRLRRSSLEFVGSAIRFVFVCYRLFTLDSWPIEDSNIESKKRIIEGVWRKDIAVKVPLLFRLLINIPSKSIYKTLFCETSRKIKSSLILILQCLYPYRLDCPCKVVVHE